MWCERMLRMGRARWYGWLPLGVLRINVRPVERARGIPEPGLGELGLDIFGGELRLKVRLGSVGRVRRGV